jgi:hypothetical protein
MESSKFFILSFKIYFRGQPQGDVVEEITEEEKRALKKET